jgi:hypothetical protein
LVKFKRRFNSAHWLGLTRSLYGLINMLEITDNFLEETELENIKNTLLNTNFPWLYSESKVSQNDSTPQFFHTLWHPPHGNNSSHAGLLGFFEKKLKVGLWARAKFNLTLPGQCLKQTEFHVDQTLKGAKTAIYYLTTTNGPTVFKGFDSVECVRNRLVCFDSKIHHAATLHTEGDVARIVLNLNFIQNENHETL